MISSHCQGSCNRYLKSPLCIIVNVLLSQSEIIRVWNHLSMSHFDISQDIKTINTSIDLSQDEGTTFFVIMCPPVNDCGRTPKIHYGIGLYNKTRIAWWRHQMETFSALLAICAGNSPVTGEFRAQRPVTQNFDVFFDLRLNIRLSKQWRGWWFETPL